jgi:hypothetical protein
MSPEQLIELLQNRVLWLQAERARAVERGDVAAVMALDADLTATSGTLALLQAAYDDAPTG